MSKDGSSSDRGEPSRSMPVSQWSWRTALISLTSIPGMALQSRVRLPPRFFSREKLLPVS